jgi:hypothetical protein
LRWYTAVDQSRLAHNVFSVEQLSSTVSEAGTNFNSDKRLGQSFYNRVDYVANRIADESEIRRGNSSITRTWLERFSAGVIALQRCFEKS